ncbi:hypothetical protein RvY_00999 [Ramazzottius varieornatus]|uniref:Uncharacterized protein n=1 Tax=Ramazzottius varieornatus TaxID=947166 RepID=A0A1D1UFN5_RAMVA|nr:hypothetical protein RvY_00999 [Ramazzottius varieornatus]
MPVSIVLSGKYLTHRSTAERARIDFGEPSRQMAPQHEELKNQSEVADPAGTPCPISRRIFLSARKEENPDFISAYNQK